MASILVSASKKLYWSISIGKMKVMVSGSEEEILKNKIDPCGMYEKRVMVNSLLCTGCRRWIHRRCAKVKRATPSMA